MKKLIIVALMLICVNASAQTRVVSGTVRDQSGSPVPFATVAETGDGGRNTVSADASGNFTIKLSGNTRLTISAAGFNSETITPSGAYAVVSLTRNTDNLTEVVVTALGQTKNKAKLGYATTTINTEQLNRSAPANPLDALAGRVPGANISKTGGPNSSSKIILRGFGNLTGSNQPLYVVDGVPLVDERFGATSNYDFGQSIADINPNDIESISVLKGTAASSLYGSLARNGALLITTKRGKSGKLKVDYAGTVNLSEVGALPVFQDQFGQGWSGVFILSENGSWGPKLDGKNRLWGPIVDNAQLLKPFSFVDDNIRKFYETGVEVNNSIALSGGGENTSFYLSYNHVSSNGPVPTNTDFLGRNNLTLRTNSRFDKFSVNTSFNYAKRKVNAPFTGQQGNGGSSLFEDLLQIPVDIPITDFRDYKNKFFNVDNYFSPYSENPYYPLLENRATQGADRFFGNIDVSYAISPSFTTQLRIGGDFDNARTFAYKATNRPARGSWNDGANPEGAIRIADVGSVSEGAHYVGLINGDFILKYNQNISTNLSLEALGGFNYFQQEAKETLAGITDLLVPGFYNLSNSTAPPSVFERRKKRRAMGTYAQATLGLKEQLFLTLNGRNDWSSTLPIDNNSFFYPGANASWLISQTLNLNPQKISLLKLRAGYGKTGADPEEYLTNQTLIIGTAILPFGSLNLPFNGVSGFGINDTLANANLKPIVTTEAEVGLEARFFRNRLGIDLALYDKNTEGQVLKVPTSPGTGYSSIIKNIGTINNRGVELALDGKPVSTPNFTWTVVYTFTKNWNKVKELTDGPEFMQLNSVYDAEMRAYPGKNAFGLYAPIPQRTDDGRIVVNAVTGMPVVQTEKGYYGDADYDYMTSLSNAFSFKGIQLSFLLDYRKGGRMYSGTGDLLQFVGNSYITTYNDRRPFVIPNSVNQAGTDSDGKPVYVENITPVTEDVYDTYWYHTSNPGMAYEYRFIDRSFLKLRDVSLSYLLPVSLSSRIGARNLSVSLYGRNFILWLPDSNVYLDPEASNLGNDFRSQFGEFRTAPTSVQFGVAIKAGF